MWRTLPMLVLLVAGASCKDLVTSAPPVDAAEASPTSPLERTQEKPIIRSLHIDSNIRYRYASTLVSTRVVNPTNQSGEATFTVTLPDAAYISEFLMDIKGEVFKAYVKEKEEAKAVYQQAVDAGVFAGHVALDARDSNQFTVSVNIEAHGKVTFNLTYEQLLARSLGVYSNVININPQQIVEDMSVTVNVEEPSTIVHLEVPELQLSNEAVPDKSNEEAKIEEISPNHKRVTWAPTPEEQRSRNSSGLSGQFIVKYDVDRKDNPQQILVDDGYFVHFFAPDDLPQLRKHVIFVLDYSGSMGGTKLEQLQEAMKQIFSDLGPKDYFSIVIFQSWVEAWSPTEMYVSTSEDYPQPYNKEFVNHRTTHKLGRQFVIEATPANIELARSFMSNYTDLGATNIIGGLRDGLKLVGIGEEVWANESDAPQPLIVFLTDGQPNVEEYDPDAIISKTKALNTKRCPIFSLAFGYGANYGFLRKLSLQNSGFARDIYEAADATQQLKNFYKTIASPLLSNITFDYLPGQVDNSSNTKVDFPVFFSGSELVVAGRIHQGNVADDRGIGRLRAMSVSGPTDYPIIIRNYTTLVPKNRSIGHLEKHWSYLTIQQLLDKADALDETIEKNDTKKKALEIALKYEFVTPLTSLVVVKPNETESSVDATKVKPGFMDGGYQNFATSGFGGGGIAMSPPSGAFYAMQSSRLPAPPAPVGPPSTPYPYQGGAASAGFPGPAISFMNVEDDAGPNMLQKVPLEDIKWLQQALNTTDKNVTLEGKQYKIGENETDTVFGDCQVNSEDGKCRHVKYCPLSTFRDDVSQFLPYRCPIPGEFLGVCCPTSV